MSTGPTPHGAELVEGWKDIGKEAGIHANTAQKWARRASDPLPVRVNHKGVFAWRSAIRSWCDRQDRPLQADDEIRALRAEVESLKVAASARVVKRPAKQAQEKRERV